MDSFIVKSDSDVLYLHLPSMIPTFPYEIHRTIIHVPL